MKPLLRQQTKDQKITRVGTLYAYNSIFYYGAFDGTRARAAHTNTIPATRSAISNL